MKRLTDDKKRKLSPQFLLKLGNLLFETNADEPLMQVLKIKARNLNALSAEGSINAYQWCKARLSIQHPDGLLAVQRFEANSGRQLKPTKVTLGADHARSGSPSVLIVRRITQKAGRFVRGLSTSCGSRA